MGSCLTWSPPIAIKHAQLNESHLLSNENVQINNTKQQTYQNNHILTDSDQHEYNYREFQQETSVTHNSNLNPVYPSSHSSPQHHQNINLLKLNNDLQRQIDILKQCSNDEIKTLKQRIQLLEHQFRSLSSPHQIRDDYKQSIDCTKNTKIKSCPNTLRIIQISKIFNEMIASSKV